DAAEDLAGRRARVVHPVQGDPAGRVGAARGLIEVEVGLRADVERLPGEDGPLDVLDDVHVRLIALRALGWGPCPDPDSAGIDLQASGGEPVGDAAAHGLSRGPGGALGGLVRLERIQRSAQRALRLLSERGRASRSLRRRGCRLGRGEVWRLRTIVVPAQRIAGPRFTEDQQQASGERERSPSPWPASPAIAFRPVRHSRASRPFLGSPAHCRFPTTRNVSVAPAEAVTAPAGAGKVMVPFRVPPTLNWSAPKRLTASASPLWMRASP